jgi:uracil-DNA glycosylase
MNALMEVSFLELLQEEFSKPYMKDLERFLGEEYGAKEAVFPPFDQVFEAFCHTRFDGVRVVIMGQDPYHGPGQAHGLSFSVPKGVPIPPSLVNIYKELVEDVGIEKPTHGCLLDWAKQGVLLLNATLTVRSGQAKSHYGRGWETFTDRVVELLSKRADPLVFLLWGKSAYEKFDQVKGANGEHLVLTAPHPSPLSAHAGFLGCRHFSKANEFLKEKGKGLIDWAIR